MSEDLNTWLERIYHDIGRIADALEQLIINQKAQMINSTLQQEDKQFNKETLEITETVLMDLKEVTVLVLTEKAALFTKKGYQKWVPFSTMEAGVPLEEGKYLEDIELTEKGNKWIPDKPWDKLKVAKK